MKCVSWTLCLTILWMVLPCLCSVCEDMMKSVRVHYVLYGQPLELFCFQVDNTSSADDLEWGREGRRLSSEKVNVTTRRLIVEQHEKGNFFYYCKNNMLKKTCLTKVLVDSAPSNVTDFVCRSQNLDDLICNWTIPKMFIKNNFTSFILQNGIYVNFCSGGGQIPKVSCEISVMGIPHYRQLDKQFFFHLQLCNRFGCNEQHFTIDHFSIVKPDKPSNLKVLSNGTHSVLLQWNIPNNMVDFLPHGVDHKIEYQIAKIDNTSYFRKVDTSGLPVKNKTYKFLLSGLPYAHMRYEVRIYIRPKEAVKDEYWSDSAYILCYTTSERPNRPPNTVVGAFDQYSYEADRRLYVYWKQLEEYEEAGANFTYKVVAHQSTGNPKTLLADYKKSYSYVVLENASLGPINVDIWATNDIGSSLNKSHLYIPPYADTVALRVPSFTKLAYENGTYTLSWVGISNIDNYTVFWCQHNTTKICNGRMNFTTLEPNKTTHVIDLPKENKYQFAISANKEAKTSGMVWATCDFSKDRIPMYGFPVNIDHGVPGKTFVNITWTMACTLQEGIITGYIITYCPVLNTSNVCDTSFDKSTVIISDTKQMAINITDLKPYRTYQFWLALNTIYGLKKIDNASTRVTTTEDTPTSPRNVTIVKVESDSVVLSWDPPLDKNGIIGKYVIYNYSEPYAVDNVLYKDKDSLRRYFTLEGLDGFSNYLLSVTACNSASSSCSQRSPTNGIFVRTRISRPSKLKSLKVVHDFIKWEIPEKPGGLVDYYQIQITRDGQHRKIYDTINLSYSLSDCEGVDDKYQVRAVNYEQTDTLGYQKNKIKQNPRLEYPGEWSDPITVKCNNEGDFSATFIIIAVVMVLFCVTVVVYELIKRYKRKESAAFL